MNNKRTKGENVYQLVQKRLKFLFNEFDNIYVSFSGGKDSGVLLNLCIQYIREHNLDRKIQSIQKSFITLQYYLLFFTIF